MDFAKPDCNVEDDGWCRRCATTHDTKQPTSVYNVYNHKAMLRNWCKPLQAWLAVTYDEGDSMICSGCGEVVEPWMDED